MDRYSSKSSAELDHTLGTCRQLAGSMQLQILKLIAACDERLLWRSDGCRDMAQWVSGRFGISNWAARRWVAAAHALKELPNVASALAKGRLSLDKVLELTRFATPANEEKLIKWASGVAPATIRHKADLAQAPALDDVGGDQRARYVRWWVDDSRMWLEGMLPVEQGAKVARALDRLAAKMASSPDDDGDDPAAKVEARRADALVMMAASQAASDPDPDRATVVVHAPLAALCGEHGSCEIEGFGVIHPEVARMLACDARIQTVLEDPEGHVVGIGRLSRNPPERLRRLLHHRDRGCNLSRLRSQALRQAPPHRSLERRRSNQPRQPRARVLLSPRPHPQARLARLPRPTARHRLLVQTRQPALRAGAGAAASRSIHCRLTHLSMSGDTSEVPPDLGDRAV